MLYVTPILNRELVGYLRRGPAFWYLLLYLAGLLLMVCIYWLHALDQATDRAQLSRNLFVTCSVIQIAVSGLLGVIIGSGQIGSERRRGTFDLLMTTPLRASEILLGKMLASVGYLLLLAVSGIPVYSLCFLLGGVGWMEVGLTIYLTVLTAVTYSMIGVACSAPPLRQRTQEQRGGMGIVVLLNGGLAMALGIVLHYVLKMADDVTGWTTLAVLIALSPVGAFCGVTSLSPLSLANPGVPSWLLGTGLLFVHTVAEIGVFFLFLMLGCRWIRKQKVAAVPHAKVRAAPKEGRRTRPAFARLFPIPDFLNPVAAKDILLVLPRRRILRIVYGLLAATLFGLGVWGLVESRSLMGSAEAQKLYDIIAMTAIGATCFITYLRASGVVVSEIEAGTMGLLVTAPLHIGRVMSGKLQAVVVNMAGLFGVFGLSLAIVFCVCHPGAMFHVVATLPAALLALVAGAAFYGSLGIRISAGAKTVRSAGTQAAVLCLLLYVAGIPMIAIGYETLTSHIGEDAVAFLGRTLSTVLFPVWQILTPGDLLPTGGSRWVWFLVGVGASLGLAQLVLQSAARVCARRMRG